MTFAKQLDQSQFMVKENQRENLELKNYIDFNTQKLAREKSNSNFEMNSRLRNIEETLRFNDVKKYY